MVEYKPKPIKTRTIDETVVVLDGSKARQATRNVFSRDPKLKARLMKYQKNLRRAMGGDVPEKELSDVGFSYPTETRVGHRPSRPSELGEGENYLLELYGHFPEIEDSVELR
jgi:hypothetical protein